MDDGHVAAQPLDDFQDVRRQEDGCAAFRHTRQQRFQSSCGEGIHAFERLVKEQNARSVNHRGSESQLLLHSVRVVRNHGLGAISELHKIQQLL